MLPLRVGGLQRRWSTGVWQVHGYTAGFYSNGTDQYSALGLDDDGRAYVPLYVGRGAADVVVGHPVIATAHTGTDVNASWDVSQVFIQAT